MNEDTFGQYTFAAEEEVLVMLGNNVLPTSGTLVCLRRKPPTWWSCIPAMRPDLVLEHAPIPPSLDTACEASLKHFLNYVLPRLRFPLLLFCKEGRHRSGMIEAMFLIRQGFSLDEAIDRYVTRTRGGAREHEIALIRRLTLDS